VLWNSLNRYQDHLLLVLRLGVGGGFIWYHGWDKIVGGPERWEGVGGAMGNLGIHFAPEFWGLMAGLGEALGGLLIVLGLFFRPAVLAVAFVMFVATINHWVTGMGTPAHSFKNFFFFVGLLAVGPGRFSLDHMLFGGRTGSPEAASAGRVPPGGAGASTPER